MDVVRRLFLQGAGLLAAGLISPLAAIAATWNKEAFGAKTAADALKNIGALDAAPSKDVVIDAPEIAENGAVVPIEVISNIPNSVSITVLSLKNPQPLAASFDFANGALPELQVRVRLADTTMVKAVVKTADGKFYTAQKEVKVTVGGCGG